MPEHPITTLYTAYFFDTSTNTCYHRRITKTKFCELACVSGFNCMVIQHENWQEFTASTYSVAAYTYHLGDFKNDVKEPIVV